MKTHEAYKQETTNEWICPFDRSSSVIVREISAIGYIYTRCEGKELVGLLVTLALGKDEPQRATHAICLWARTGT